MAMQRPDTDDPGLLTLGDFAAYRAKWRTPLVGAYHGRGIVAMPPPTSGGVALLEMLNLFKGFDLPAWGASTTATDHVIAEAQKLAFTDRGTYLADPDFVRQPVDQLISKDYADQRRPEIDPNGPAHTYSPGAFTGLSGRGSGVDRNSRGSTTHVSVIDRRGGAVAVTCTIEQEFGSAVVAPGTGFLLNNELTDFSGPGTANEPAPGKRPRSSMSPTIVVRDRRPEMVVGGAGGARIIMGVLESILQKVDFGQDLPHALDAERLDNLGSGRLNIEDARVDPGVLAELEARGHTLVREGEYGPRPRVQAAGEAADGRTRTAASDSRSDRGSYAVP
jgi:gamma-glutamyltranspeptidase/glutathione hydrolase